MKKALLTFVLIITFQNLYSQQMNLTKLGKILNEVSDSIQSNRSQWNFKIKDVFFICIADSTHNRMRIISPISDVNRLDEKLKENALIANFHTALDVKYAISDAVLWAVFIHPLKELTSNQVFDAISQTYYANINFGTTFSSTSLVFPGRKSPKKEVKEKHSIKKI